MKIDASHFLTKHAAWTITNLGFGYMDYRGRVNEGQAAGQALVGAAATTAFYEMFPGLGMASLAATAASIGVPGYVQWRQQADKDWSRMHKPNMGGMFKDNQNAMNMRQRSAQQIQEHHGLARSVLGREARFMK